MWCSPLVLGPITVLGCLAQLHVWRDLAYPATEKPLPRGEETQEGWAALPEELLCRIMALAKGAPGPLLFATYGSPALRSVCRSWRRVHDERVTLFLKPSALHPDSLIARFPSLEALDLSRTKFPDHDAVFALVLRLPRLASLTLKTVGAGPRLAATLADALGATTKLKVLNLSANGARAPETATCACQVARRRRASPTHAHSALVTHHRGASPAHARSAGHTPSPTHVRTPATRAGVGAKGAASFADALKARSCSLRVLNLRDNMIPASGAVALAAALRHNSGLQELDLSANAELGHEGAVALSGALVHNTTLLTLNLGGCSLGDDGCMALAQSLRSFGGLRHLSLFSNDITDSGVTELASAAAANCGVLRSLELRGNPRVGAEGVAALTAAACANPALLRIELDAPPAPRPGAPPLPAAVAAAAADMALALASLADVLEHRQAPAPDAAAASRCEKD